MTRRTSRGDASLTRRGLFTRTGGALAALLLPAATTAAEPAQGTSGASPAVPTAAATIPARLTWADLPPEQRLLVMAARVRGRWIRETGGDVFVFESVTVQPGDWFGVRCRSGNLGIAVPAGAGEPEKVRAVIRAYGAQLAYPLATSEFPAGEGFPDELWDRAEAGRVAGEAFLQGVCARVGMSAAMPQPATFAEWLADLRQLRARYTQRAV